MTNLIHTRSDSPTSVYLPREMETSVQFSSVSSVQFSSFARSCPTLCDPMKTHLPKKEMLSVRNRIPAGICQDVQVRVWTLEGYYYFQNSTAITVWQIPITLNIHL